MGAVTPGETLGTLYNIHVGSNKTKQHHCNQVVIKASEMRISLGLRKRLEILQSGGKIHDH